MWIIIFFDIYCEIRAIKNERLYFNITTSDKLKSHKNWLHLINISSSNVLSFKRHLSGRNTFPAMLNNLSTGAEDAGMHKCTGTSLANVGYFISLTFQNSRGFSSCGSNGAWRYSSTFASTVEELLTLSAISKSSKKSFHFLMWWWLWAWWRFSRLIGFLYYLGMRH